MHFIEGVTSCLPCRSSLYLHTSKRMHFIEGDANSSNQHEFGGNLHTSKRMHFIEGASQGHGIPTALTCIRQNVCTSLKGNTSNVERSDVWRPCIRQNVCTSLKANERARDGDVAVTCIRQNVCTSLKGASARPERSTNTCLHTSKRMHFIEGVSSPLTGHTKKPCIRQNVCTSLRGKALVCRTR